MFKIKYPESLLNARDLNAGEGGGRYHVLGNAPMYCYRDEVSINSVCDIS